MAAAAHSVGVAGAAARLLCGSHFEQVGGARKGDVRPLACLEGPTVRRGETDGQERLGCSQPQELPATGIQVLTLVAESPSSSTQDIQAHDLGSKIASSVSLLLSPPVHVKPSSHTILCSMRACPAILYSRTSFNHYESVPGTGPC